jgi:hypothetical protein
MALECSFTLRNRLHRDDVLRGILHQNADLLLQPLNAYQPIHAPNIALQPDAAARRHDRGDFVWYNQRQSGPDLCVAARLNARRWTEAEAIPRPPHLNVRHGILRS